MSDVLIVFDDPDHPSPAGRILAREGLSGSIAHEPEVAWKTLLFERPDLILIDQDVAGDEGWAFIQRVRGDLRTYSLPILVMTDARNADPERAQVLAAELIDRSFLASQLLGRMQNAIARALELKPPADGVPVLDQKRVRLYLTGGDKIDGIVHVPGELDRFSDSWDAVMREARAFIALTEARRLPDASDPDTEPLGFVLVRKSDIRLVIPQG